MRNIGTGKRKTSVARVFIDSNSKNFQVNGKPVEEYFKRSHLLQELKKPLVAADQEGKIGIIATVHGGGMSGQAGALRHGIARALIDMNPSFRAILKPAGLLTRDARKVERKKPGQKKSRKSPQFSKR